MNAVSARPLTVGKSMRSDVVTLGGLGGFAPVGDVLAEDYALGRRFLDASFLVRTSLHTVENRNVACSMMRAVERHTRWSKLRRAVFPAGFTVEPILSPIVVASLAMVLAPGEMMATLLGMTSLLQTASALVAVRILRGRGWRGGMRHSRSFDPT